MVRMIKRIVTHPGGAHKDEFLACCVLLAEYPVPIFRRDPSEAELESASVAVVDVGHRHEPELANFDHHQFPREHPPICALSLVLDHLGLYEDARLFWDWLEAAERFDSRGPNDVAAWLKIPREAVSTLNSPLDITIIRRFAAVDELESDDPLWQIMKFVGEDLLHYLRTLRQRLDWIADKAVFWEVDDFKVLFLERANPLPDDPGLGLGRYIEEQGLKEEVAALVYPDRRGDGYGLSTFNDDPRLDFAELKKEEDVHFAHVRGFVAKTSATDPERLKALLRLGRVTKK